MPAAEGPMPEKRPRLSGREVEVGWGRGRGAGVLLVWVLLNVFHAIFERQE